MANMAPGLSAARSLAKFEVGDPEKKRLWPWRTEVIALEISSGSGYLKLSNMVQ